MKSINIRTGSAWRMIRKKLKRAVYMGHFHTTRALVFTACLILLIMPVFLWLHGVFLRIHVTALILRYQTVTLEERVLKWLLYNASTEEAFTSLEEHESVHFTRHLKHNRSFNLIELTSTSNSYTDSLKSIQSLVTILIFSSRDTIDCVANQIASIRRILPLVKIIVASLSDYGSIRRRVAFINNGEFTEGRALNAVMRMVDTANVLYLPEGITMPSSFSRSLRRMLNALENVPDLDIVGGSVFHNMSRLLERPCYRLSLCRWKFRKSYEYKYSVGDLMICDETSSAFMAKRTSLLSLGLFDDSMDVLTVTDFFFRAKQKGAVVGLLPNVFFRIQTECLNPPAIIGSYRPFMKKYDVRTFIDQNERVITWNKARETFTQFILQTLFPFRGAWGIPTKTESVRQLLHLNDEFFSTKQNSSYVVEGGVALSGIKMRDVLPWDSSNDIDTLYHGSVQTIWVNMREFYEARGYSYDVIYRRNIHNEINVVEPTHAVRNTFFPYLNLSSPLMYIPIDGAFIPVERSLFQGFRKAYGIIWLQFLEKGNKPIACSRPGHHACISKSLRHGGGHWSDFHCHV